MNDHEIGAVIEWATHHPCVRGVTLQPIQFAGRIDGVEQQTARLTLTDVRQRLLEQCPIFEPNDVIPVPCNPDALAMGYALRTAGRHHAADAIHRRQRCCWPAIATRSSSSRTRPSRTRSSASSPPTTRPKPQAKHLASLLCCLPGIDAPPSVGYDSVFRVLIMAFMDATAFDVRAMKKSCVHIVQPDGRIIPFESFNLLYRDDRRTVLDERRAEVEQLFQIQRSVV